MSKFEELVESIVQRRDSFHEHYENSEKKGPDGTHSLGRGLYGREAGAPEFRKVSGKFEKINPKDVEHVKNVIDSDDEMKDTWKDASKYRRKADKSNMIPRQTMDDIVSMGQYFHKLVDAHEKLDDTHKLIAKNAFTKEFYPYIEADEDKWKK